MKRLPTLTSNTAAHPHLLRRPSLLRSVLDRVVVVNAAHTITTVHNSTATHHSSSSSSRIGKTPTHFTRGAKKSRRARHGLTNSAFAPLPSPPILTHIATTTIGTQRTRTRTKTAICSPNFPVCPALGWRRTSRPPTQAAMQRDLMKRRRLSRTSRCRRGRREAGCWRDASYKRWIRKQWSWGTTTSEVTTVTAMAARSLLPGLSG